MNPQANDYLAACEIIDCRAPTVQQVASKLASSDPVATAKCCFEFVRDEIRHSSDFQQNPVTCAASEVLEFQTGYCYAKSHLLCALLRASDIPSALCYQRLSQNDVGPPFCLHGLVAALLPDFGWYRMDARGNRQGINARFVPPQEQLAFDPKPPDEYDLPGKYATPLNAVVNALRGHHTWDSLLQDLPDVGANTPTAV